MESISSGVKDEYGNTHESKTGRLVCTIAKPGICMLGERPLAIRHMQYKELERISDCIIVRIYCQSKRFVL